MALVTYKCKDCGKEMHADERARTPDCCGGKMDMMPLDPCTHPMAAEASRPGVSDEACDDGVK